MRISKKLWVFFFVASIFTACKDDDNTSFVLQEISAPTNVSAVFDIAQDDSGEVTVTPTGIGASIFEVFFGDVENETPVEVAPGETITKTYGEGEFTLKIVAIGATGLTSELSRVVTISFTPPTELAVAIAISETNPFEITISPTAQNATVFDVLFGDEGEDGTPTTIMSGETVNHIYAEAGEYTVSVVARGAGLATIEVTETVTISGEADPIELPITFDIPTVNYAFGTFNGASYEVVDNPDVNGANAIESKVGAITNSGAQFEGGAFNLGTPVDFSGDSKTISMKFWATSALPVLLKFEGGVNDERQTEVIANHGGTGWEVLTFDFGTDAIKSFIDGNQGVGEAFVPDGQYATIVIFVDGPGTTAGTFYLDDIAQSAGETTPLELPITFDGTGVNYDFGTFNGAAFEVVDNPDASGANAEVSKVGAITNSGAQFEGGAFALDTPVDFSTDKTITMKLWSQTSLPILLKFEGGVSGERENEVIVTHGGTGWEDLSFNFATNATKSFIDGNQGVGEAFVPEGQYATLVLFIDGPGSASGTFYVDDIVQSGGDDTTAGGVATSLPIGFENGETLSGVFEAADGVTGLPISNPDASGLNTSATVYEFNKVAGAAWFSGIFQIFPSDIDLSTNQVVTFKMWSPKSGINVRVQLEKEGGGGGATFFVDQPVNVANEWITINANFSGLINTADAYDKIVIFPDFDDVNTPAGDGSIYYIDDIELTLASGGGTGGKTIFPVDFESPTAGAASQWNVFENDDNPALQIIANPDASGANTSTTVAQFIAKANGQPFAGTETPLEVPLTLDATNSTVKILVWKSVISDVGIKFARADGGSTGEIKVPNTVTNQWEELTFDFSGVIGDPNNSGIEFLVVFPDFDARTQDNIVYFDTITLSANDSGGSDGGTDSSNPSPNVDDSAASQVAFPVGFESTALTYSFVGFEGADSAIEANPDATGINPTATVMRTTKTNGSQFFAGTFLDLEVPIDFSSTQKVSLKTWSPKAGVPVRVALENAAGGVTQIFVDVNTTTANAWEELVFDFSSVVDNAAQYNRIVVFFEFIDGLPGDGSTYYYDDIQLIN